MNRLALALFTLLLLVAPEARAQADPWADYRIPTDWQGHRYTPSPQDWRQLAVYQVMTDRFFNGDPSNDQAHDFSDRFGLSSSSKPGWRRTIGGDFKGLTQHLDYVKSLGFDVDAVLSNPPPRRDLFESLYFAGPVGRTDIHVL